MENPGTMYSSDEGSDNEGMDVAGRNNSALCLAGKSLLKPKLDSIFAEVEKNLPSIDFDLSDVSSDSEEPVIFQRHLIKTYIDDDDKDFDTSLNEESLSELLHSSRDNMSLNSNTVEDGELGSSISQPVYDNDLALQIQKSNKATTSTGTSTTSWTEVVIEAREDAAKFSERPQVKMQNWLEESDQPIPDLSDALSMIESEMMRRVESQENLFDINSFTEKDDSDENIEKHEKESNKENAKKTTNHKSGDPKVDRYLQQELRRDQEREIVSNMVSSQPLKLNMGSLGSLDIDMVLGNMNEENQLAIPIIQEVWPEANRIESVFAAGEGSNKTETNENKTLIERLALMSMEESGIDLTDVDPNTGAHKGKSTRDSPVEPDNDQRQIEGEVKDRWGRSVKRPPTPDSADKDDMRKETNLVEPVKKTSSCGTNTADTGNQPPKIIIPRVKPKDADTSPKKQEPDTVFLDLRNFDKTRQEQQENIERVQRILKIRPEQNGDSSDEDEVSVDCWRDVRNKIKTNLSSKGVSTEVLPDKPQLSRTYKDARQPQRVINMIPQTQGQGDNLPVPTPGAQDAEAEVRRKAEQEEKEKRKKMEEAKKLREQRESERQARVRLCNRLNALRPQASVSGKQDSAETTPVVFDIDVSYEPAPRSLPTIMQPDQECLLLTVHLSSNGEIILHRGKNKSVDTGIGLSASYTVLLTWLMSFVPDNYNFLQPQVAKEDEGGVQFLVPPFYVVGLQQLWLDEQHALVVAVTPTQQFRHKHIKHKKSKVKDEVKDSSPFQQHLAKFLSTNTLHTVCPWLQDLVSGEVPSSQVDPATGSPSYIYRPPLPNITNKPLSTFIQINPDHSAAQKVFNTSVGFFFQTVDSDDSSADLIINDSGVNYDTQNTMSLIYKKIFQDPRATMGIFNRVLQEGLDLAGVRLLYPTPELLNLASGKPSMPTDNSEAKSDLEMLNNIGPVLAVSIRGTFGRTIWLDAVGPSDPSLARRTDPNSLCALYGGSSRDECLLFCPRNQNRVHIELTRWFGGRVPPGGVIDVGTPYTKKDHHRSGSPKGRKGRKVTFNEFRERDDKPVVVPSRRPPATLTATTRSDIFLVMSPTVGPRCIGIVMATCQRRGYQVRGIRRSRLTTKKASSLGIGSEAVPIFCPGTQTVEGVEGADFVTVLCPQERNQEALLPCTLLLLEKENAAHHAASLIEACMVQLTLQGVMGTIQKTVDFPINSKQLFHAARFSDGLQAVLGGELSKCVDYEISVNPSFVVPKLYTNPEVEEVVVLLILGHSNLKSNGLLVGQLLNMVPYSKTPISLPLAEGFELLGIKWVPSLTLSQAKEVTPYEVGDRQWKKNIHTLTDEPALILVLRGINGFEKLNSVITNLSHNPQNSHIDYLMSQTPEEAYSFARSFFTERELFADPQSRSLLPYLPSIKHFTQGKDKERGTTVIKESIFDLMQRGPQSFTTFLLIKPRAVRRHLSKILKKIVQEKFHITALRFCVLDRSQAMSILEEKDMDGDLLEKHLSYLTSGPCVYLTLERENAVKYLLDLLGPMDPQGARRQSQFYWRGVFGVDPVLNALHASKDYLTAVAEQNCFFPEGLCCMPMPSLQQDEIKCPAEDTTIAVRFHEERDVLVHDKHNEGDDKLTDSMHQLLLQTTCIVLKPGLVRPKGKRKCGYTDIIDGLLTNGFEIVGARMLWFTQKQAEHYLHVIQAGSFQQVPLLTSGPCIVLALERDNAVIAFDSLMGSSYGSDSLISQYGEDITRPSDLTQAHNMLRFFFDKLIPGSQVEIVPKTTKQ
ncbi:dynein axonemal assembly factor 8-like [Ylistrum balloti]|uniref:dynein axonemal assembly factor 8-like n=1 Tax=Ylistrum balloti TaxID=509963 RepID=UPI002905B744|nr:dynein axonemal assembly factor 8-like [Ylistrum balloti]